LSPEKLNLFIIVFTVREKLFADDPLASLNNLRLTFTKTPDTEKYQKKKVNPKKCSR
jgi:hypothetical protein